MSVKSFLLSVKFGLHVVQILELVHGQRQKIHLKKNMNERRGREANVNKIAFCCCYFMYFIIIIIFIGCCVLVVVVGIVSHPYIDIKQESEMDGSESQGLLFSHTSVAYRGQIFFYFIMLSFYYAS